MTDKTERVRENRFTAEELKLLQELPPKRGTVEWDNREWRRAAAGCSCLSFGPLPK